MNRQQQLRELNSLTEAQLEEQFEELKNLSLPKAHGAGLNATIDEVKEAKTRLAKLTEPLGASLGITRIDGEFGLVVTFMYIPSDTSRDAMQEMIDLHPDIGGIPIQYRISTIPKAL
jgi:hypothetical protein